MIKVIQEFIDDMAELIERSGVPDTLRGAAGWLAERIEAVRGDEQDDEEPSEYVQHLMDKWEPYLGISERAEEQFIEVEGLDGEHDAMLDVCAPGPDEEVDLEGMDKILTEMADLQRKMHEKVAREMMMTPKEFMKSMANSAAMRHSNGTISFHQSGEVDEQDADTSLKCISERDDRGGDGEDEGGYIYAPYKPAFTSRFGTKCCGDNIFIADAGDLGEPYTCDRCGADTIVVRMDYSLKAGPRREGSRWYEMYEDEQDGD